MKATRPEKLINESQLHTVKQACEAANQTLVFTNGVFDLLHVGHVRYLIDSKAQGDILAVGINSDDSVRRLGKGPDRPVRPEAERAEILCALECVDYVTIYDDTHVSDLLRRLRPHIYTKGGDYTIDTINPGLRAAIEEEGFEIRFLRHAPGVSTTLTLEKMRRAGMKPEEDDA